MISHDRQVWSSGLMIKYNVLIKNDYNKLIILHILCHTHTMYI